MRGKLCIKISRVLCCCVEMESSSSSHGRISNYNHSKFSRSELETSYCHMNVAWESVCLSVLETAILSIVCNGLDRLLDTIMVVVVV